MSASHTTHRTTAARTREELTAIHAAYDGVVHLPPFILAAADVTDVVSGVDGAQVRDNALQVVAGLLAADVGKTGGEIQFQREAEKVVDFVPLVGEVVEGKSFQLEEEEGEVVSSTCVFSTLTERPHLSQW